MVDVKNTLQGRIIRINFVKNEQNSQITKFFGKIFYKKQKSFNASVEEIKSTQLYCIKSLPQTTKLNNDKILTLSDTITKTGKELIWIIICHPLNIWQVVLKIQPFLFPFIIRLKIKYNIISLQNVKYMGQGIQEWTKYNLWKIAFQNLK